MLVAHLKTKASRLLAAGVLLAALACQQDGLAPELDPNLQSEDLTVVNDEATLARRVLDLPGDTLAINAPSGMVSMDGAAARVIDHVTLTRVAEVLPPELNGAALQATHIATYGILTYVAYGQVGPGYGGGVDVFSTLTDRPRLVSQALVHNADVHSVSEENHRLYVSMSTNRADYASPAALAEVRLVLGVLTNRYRMMDLPSYAATSAVRRGDDVFVTTGSSDDGGLFRVGVQAWDLNPVELHRDARAVDADDGHVVTMSGTPGVLRVYDAAVRPLGSYDIGGASVAESKSDVAVESGHAFVAAGDAGLKIVRLVDGAVVAEVAMSRMTETVGADDVTNGVTVNHDLIFLANGAAGLYILRYAIDDQGDLRLSRVGNVVLPDGMSVNHVGSRGNRVFVASGNGGLQIIRIVSR